MSSYTNILGPREMFKVQNLQLTKLPSCVTKIKLTKLTSDGISFEVLFLIVYSTERIKLFTILKAYKLKLKAYNQQVIKTLQ